MSQVPPFNLRLQPPYFNPLNVLYISFLSSHFLLQPSVPLAQFSCVLFPYSVRTVIPLIPVFVVKQNISFVRELDFIKPACMISIENRLFGNGFAVQESWYPSRHDDLSYTQVPTMFCSAQLDTKVSLYPKKLPLAWTAALFTGTMSNASFGISYFMDV